MSRMTELLKGAVELNLRYTSTLLHLSKDYLKDANVVLTRDPPAPAPTTPDAPGAQRPPLLVVGRSGEVANAAFAINNPGEREMQVHLVVQGEVDERHVRVEPSRFTLKAGEGVIVRILATIDEKLPAEQDMPGAVVAPGLSNQSVPFIVRRLADVPADPAKPPSPDLKGKTRAPAAPRTRRAKA
ncbi:MAG: hypothetical protein Q8L96_04375 [Hylemonella sp.]|jgi:hypothetical protein|nr:hypothetical protein [Hylemonella sp.]